MANRKTTSKKRRRKKPRTKQERHRRFVLRHIYDEQQGQVRPRPSNSAFRRHLFELLVLLDPAATGDRSPDPKQPWRSLWFQWLGWLYKLSYAADQQRLDIADLRIDANTVAARLALDLKGYVMPWMMPRRGARVDRVTRVQARALALVTYAPKWLKHSFADTDLKAVSDKLRVLLGDDRDPSGKWNRNDRSEHLDALLAFAKNQIREEADGQRSVKSAMFNIANRVALSAPLVVTRQMEKAAAAAAAQEYPADAEKIVTAIFRAYGVETRGFWNYRDRRVERGDG